MINPGVTYLPVTTTISRYYGLGVNSGALITDISQGSLLSQAGVKPGDVIVSFNGVIIGDNTPLLGMLRECHPGGDIVLEIWNYQGYRQIDINNPANQMK